MFKNIMLGWMAFLLIAGVVIVVPAYADHDKKYGQFERVGSADGCDLYAVYSNGVRLFMAVGNQYRTCALTK